MLSIETYVNIKQLQLPHGISVYPPNTNSLSCTMVTVFFSISIFVKYSVEATM